MKSLLFSLFAIMSAPAFASHGPQGSGGGKAVVCRDSKNRVESVELLDLWEAREVYRAPLIQSKAPLEKQIADGIEALKNATQIELGDDYVEGDKKWTEPDYMADWLARVSKMLVEKNPKYVFLVRDATLVLTDDSNEVLVPQGRCKIEQVVNYVDSQQFPHILVSEELLSKMNNTNKAALFLHEAFYVFLRGYSGLSLFDQNRDTDSVRVRRAIGYVFSGHKFASLDSLLPDRFVSCYSENAKAPTMPSRFYAFMDDKDQPHEVTTQIFGKRMIGLVDNQSSILPEALLNHEKCDNPGSPDAHQMGPGVFNIFGSGPVDYQMQVWMDPACDHNKTVLILMADSHTGPPNQEAQIVRCEWINKKDMNKFE